MSERPRSSETGPDSGINKPSAPPGLGMVTSWLRRAMGNLLPTAPAEIKSEKIEEMPPAPTEDEPDLPDPRDSFRGQVIQNEQGAFVIKEDFMELDGTSNQTAAEIAQPMMANDIIANLASSVEQLLRINVQYDDLERARNSLLRFMAKLDANKNAEDWGRIALLITQTIEFQLEHFAVSRAELESMDAILRGMGEKTSQKKHPALWLGMKMALGTIKQKKQSAQ